MKRTLSILTLLATFLIIGCNPINKIMDLADQRKIQICTKGKSTACDSKEIVYLNQVSYQDPTKATWTVGTNRVVLYVTMGNQQGRYIGAENVDWQAAWNSIKNLDPSQQDHALTVFFQDQFDNFKFLKPVETPNPNTKVNEITSFTYNGGTLFSEIGQSSKDLEAMGARIEVNRFKNLAERLEVNYGLSTIRAEYVAKNLSTFNKLSKKRALTINEKNFFSKELLGAKFDVVENAFQSGDKKDLDNLLDAAAEVNETSPEQVSAIINELFL